MPRNFQPAPALFFLADAGHG